MIYYLIIGFLYWAINSFVRKLETNGDWMLPLVWLFAWPLAFLTWFVILIQHLMNWSKNKKI